MASPFILTIDKAIVQSAAGKASMGRALLSGLGSTLLQPHRMMRSPSYWMVMSVYAATYSVANLVDTICERKLDQEDANSAKKHSAAKLVGTTAANSGAGIWKDAMFAKMFGATAVAEA